MMSVLSRKGCRRSQQGLVPGCTLEVHKFKLDVHMYLSISFRYLLVVVKLYIILRLHILLI